MSSRTIWTLILLVPIALLVVVALVFVIYSVVEYLVGTGDFATVLAAVVAVSALMGFRLWWSSRMRDKE